MRPRIHTTRFSRVEIFKNMKQITQKDNTVFLALDWQNKKLKLQEKFPQLTNDDLVYEEGHLRELILRIQHRLGKTRYEVQQLLDEL